MSLQFILGPIYSITVIYYIYRIYCTVVVTISINIFLETRREGGGLLHRGQHTTHKPMDIATYRLKKPRSQLSENKKSRKNIFNLFYFRALKSS